VDENGFNDIILGGSFNGLKLILANSDGTDYTISTLEGPGIFLQNANIADINNDGTIDFFACNDVGISSAYNNDGTGILTYDLSLINAASTIPSDNSGNYGSIWTDYDNDGDLDMYLSKCRLGVEDPLDGRRVNLLFQNNGDNSVTDVAEIAGLRPLEQTWSTAFEDIDNDGDLDAIMINHPNLSRIYENNGDGSFTDITISSGIETELQDVGFGIQVAMADFDNDTFIDILMTTLDGNHHLFLNNGDKTFTSVIDPFPTTNGKTLQSTAIGDLNNDGFIDLIAGYAESFNSPSNTSDQLFMNSGNSNNWSKIILEGVESNSNGIGARVELYGAWGMQVREVRAGESYGTQNSFTSHFGIGSETEIDQIIIRWPSGTIDQLDNPNSNEIINIVEGQVLGTEDFNLNSKILLYPNPSKNNITLKFNFNKERVSVRIYSITGELVYQKEMSGIYEEFIDITHLDTGLYFISVENQTVKMIKK